PPEHALSMRPALSITPKGTPMPPTNRVYRVAVIPGDGIGQEVVAEGVRQIEAVSKKFGFEVRQDHFDFASYDYYAKHERMMPENWKDHIAGHDAIFLGVGWVAPH